MTLTLTQCGSLHKQARDSIDIGKSSDDSLFLNCLEKNCELLIQEGIIVSTIKYNLSHFFIRCKNKQRLNTAKVLHYNLIIHLE